MRYTSVLGRFMRHTDIVTTVSLTVTAQRNIFSGIFGSSIKVHCTFHEMVKYFDCLGSDVHLPLILVEMIRLR